MAETEGLTDTLNIIEDETSGSRITLDDIVTSLNHRGFGALLMAPALLMVLPTGAIPGLPACCGAIICLVSGQVVFGRHYPWIPETLKKLSFRRQKFLSVIDRAKSYTKIIDACVGPRLAFFSHALLQKIIAVVCFLLGMAMILIGFIPFMPAVLAVPVLFFALGISARDGYMIIAGYVFTCAAVVLVLWLSGFMGGEDRIHIRESAFIAPTPYFVDIGSIP